MSKNSDEFFEAMLKEAASEESSGADAGNTFAERMAALESEITTRINEVEKNLLNNIQKTADGSNDEGSETPEETPEEPNERED